MRSSWLLIIFVTVFVHPEYACGQPSNQLARGAQLWNLSCNQCHNRRSPLERTDAQWDVIASHMRTRANLTKSEVRGLIAFLQEANGDQGPARESSASRPEADSTATGQTGARVERHARRGRPREALGSRLWPSRIGSWTWPEFMESGKPLR